MVEILFILQAMEVPLPDHWESTLVGENIECSGWELPKKISRRRVRVRRSYEASKTAGDGDMESAGFDTASTNLVPGASQQDDVSTRTPTSQPGPASSDAPEVSTDLSTDDSCKPFKKRMCMR